MSKRIVVIPDTQIPLEDRKATAAVLGFIGEYQPDEVIHIGDLMDYPKPSRWSKGTAAEFQGSVFAESDYAKRHFLEPLRNVYEGPVGVIEGNHDERPRVYLATYAPALSESKAFNFENLLDFDGFRITKLPDIYEFAPGWIATHGHRAGIRLNQQPGRTALNAAMSKFQRSVIMGHTHRLAALPNSYGYNGKVTKTLWGIEVGNLMDMKRAQYLKGGAANWQQGFVILHVDGSYVSHDLIVIQNRRFTVQGNTFKF